MAKDEIVPVKATVDKVAKRKTVVQDSDNSAPNKSSIGELYSKVVAAEEIQARKRDADEDAQLYFDACKEIGLLLIDIASLKLQNEEKTAAEIKEKQSQITLKILMLKKLNRLEKVRTKDCRLSLQNYREQVDNDNLHLQNLVYEQLHLSKEVTKCYEFKSIDEDMDLIDIDEFYASAPEEISKPNLTKNNPHELKLARLSWELMQRKQLAAKLKKLEAAKDYVAKEIEAKKEQLSKLEPHLNTALEATKPLQETLGIFVDKTKKLHELALLLPKPLYVLFVQAEAYCSLAKWMTVGIVGKAEEISVPEDHFDDISSADSDSDEGEPVRRRKVLSQDRRKASGNVNGETADQRHFDCIKRHPLSVELKICLGEGNSVTLQFQWLTTLEIVCLLPSISVNVNAGVAAADLLVSTSILSVLFPGDNGENSPNPATFYHLQRAGLKTFPTSNAHLGIPYIWAQTMCGITFIPQSFSLSVDDSRRSLEKILFAIRSRLKNRLNLAKEVKLLESGEYLKDHHLQSKITSFTAEAISDLQRVPTAAQLFEKGIINNTFLAYRVGIDVNDVKVIAFIAVSPSYPSILPTFFLEVHRKKVFTAANCDHIRDIERQVNTSIEVEGDILLKQIHKLLLSCEVLVATEFVSDRPLNVTFFRAVSGRARNHPYRYSTVAGGIFTHRM